MTLSKLSISHAMMFYISIPIPYRNTKHLAKKNKNEVEFEPLFD